jgi:arginyl-tRNA synthetase
VKLPIVLEQPPKIEMGEAASPVCFELARRLKRAPRQIAQEIQNGLPPVAGIARIDVAGAGYLNAYFDRGAFWEAAKAEATRAVPQGLKPGTVVRVDVGPKGPTPKGQTEPDVLKGNSQKWLSHKIIVEHTSINPNKAAHIGHVRNAVLGDTMARTLRQAGHNVQVQNYIDNTGVQVADVVIGLLQMERRTAVGVKMLAMDARFDYYCWDVYAKATQFFAEGKRRRSRRWWRMRLSLAICGLWRVWEFFMSCWRGRARFCICIFGIWLLRS